MTSEWSWKLNYQKYPVYSGYCAPEVHFLSVSLYDHTFSGYKVIENWKSTEWPQSDIEHLTVKRSLYTLNTYLWGSRFTPVSLYGGSILS